jgi:hypothetical protein
MARSKFNSRVLRQLAEDLLDQAADEYEISADEREDCVTSLVRQWITYDGNATFFVGDQQVYLTLGKTPLGRPRIVPARAFATWTKKLTEDWKIDPDDLDDAFEQLNRGQSAEVINSDGVPLRLWVNPKERRQGVEPLVKEEIPPGTERDYRKIAADVLEEHFGESFDPEEIEALACSIAKQWRQYDGHACLFLDAHQQFHFQLTERSDGGCDVVSRQLAVDLEPVLAYHGFSPDVFSEVIARMNLGQEIEFRDRKGVRRRLWHDPKARRICFRTIDSVPPRQGTVAKPILCPKCTAVLPSWQEAERQKTCIHCGHIVSRS